MAVQTIRPKNGDVVWANVTENLSRKVKITEKRKVKGQIQYRASYMMPNGGSRWITSKQLIKYV